MVRISNSRVAFFEPAKGIARSLVRAFGLRPEVEVSGNAVYEFSRKELREVCRKVGAQLCYFSKSLVTGPTTEPKLFERLDSSGITPGLCAGITIANRLLGPVIGTKCSVVIERAQRSVVAIPDPVPEFSPP